MQLPTNCTTKLIVQFSFARLRSSTRTMAGREAGSDGQLLTEICQTDNSKVVVGTSLNLLARIQPIIFRVKSHTELIRLDV